MTLLTESVPEWLDEFSAVNDKRVLWDLIKYRIRQISIKYSKEGARKKREKISQIENLLRTFEENYSNSPSNEHFEQLETLKTEYDKRYEDIEKGAIIRSKATWYEKREKNNNFF